jgi:small nuclear ribonucleoprotein (snRNP)-like protein
MSTAAEPGIHELLNHTVEVSLAGSQRATACSGVLRGIDGAMNVALANAAFTTGAGSSSAPVAWAFIVGANVRYFGVPE